MVLAERLQIPLRDTAGNCGVQGGADEGATFDEIVGRYDRTVHNIVRSLVHNPQDVEDVSQEVWIKVANNLANLRDQERLLPWLYRISRNCALSFLTTQKNRQQVANTDEDDIVDTLASPLTDGPEAQAISVVERREVWAALAELSPADRTVLLLREFRELPYADIARELNISRGNAEVRVFRARTRFRQLFVKREESMARGFLGLPLLGLLGKLRLLLGVSGAVSTPATATVTAAGAATGVTAAGATTGAGVAAEVGVGIVAKLVITAAALSVAAGAVSVATPEVAPSSAAPEAHVPVALVPAAPATSADVSFAARPASGAAAVAVGPAVMVAVPQAAQTSGLGAPVSASVRPTSLPVSPAPAPTTTSSPAEGPVTQPPLVPVTVDWVMLPAGNGLAPATIVGAAPTARAASSPVATVSPAAPSIQSTSPAVGSGNSGSANGGVGSQDKAAAPAQGHVSTAVTAPGGQGKAPGSGHASDAAPATSSNDHGGQDNTAGSNHGNDSGNASVDNSGQHNAPASGPSGSNDHGSSSSSGQNSSADAGHASNNQSSGHGHQGH